MPQLATLIKNVKQFALDPYESDVEFTNAFLYPYVCAGNIKNRNKEDFYLDKTATSLLLNYKQEVPTALTKALGQYEIGKRTAENMPLFLIDHINPSLYLSLTTCLMKMIQADPKISSADQEVLEEQSGDAAYLLAMLQIRSFSESNLGDPNRRIIWKQGANMLEIIEGDLFYYGFNNRKKNTRNIVVIPVNTAFDTHVTRKVENDPMPVVSETTLHGQWVTRMIQSGTSIVELDQRIKESLSCHGYIPTKTIQSENAKNTVYEIGSIAVIETSNTIYYLLAISEFDEFNHAQSSSSDIATAVRSLLTTYNGIGQGYDMYLPLMGTGRSRAGLTLKESYEKLTQCMIDYSNMIQGHIYLVVRPDDMAEIEEEQK